MENPFSLKVGQMFTGFGIGCGVGVGIGRPIYLGAIPALQPVLCATRGATDVLIGVGRHFSSYLQRLGMKRIEAGIGCGVGIGHGFGVGIALKPGVLHGIGTSLTETVINIMANMGIASSLSSIKNFIPDSTQSGVRSGNLQDFVGGPLDVSKTPQSKFKHSVSDGAVHNEIPTNTSERICSFTSTPQGNRAENVLNKFLQSSDLRNERGAELDEVARHLHTENNALHLLLKHQEIIEKLMDENQKLHKILIEDLKVPPDKLQAISGANTSFKYPCTDCFECRRRRRRTWKT